MGWRLIDSQRADPYYITAADEALIQARAHHHSLNTLHFYTRNTPTISVGRSRSLADDINIDRCTHYHIPIIRRTTGGGTIFTDPGCLIYSLIFQSENTPAPQIFREVCTSLINALSALNITTTFKPPNDILLDGKKISGSAQLQKHDITLIHGTILINTDLELMKNIMMADTSQVTTLKEQFSKYPDMTTIKQEIITSFQHLFHTTFTTGDFTVEENQITQELLQKRYQQKTWNYQR